MDEENYRLLEDIMTHLVPEKETKFYSTYGNRQLFKWG